ncbi:HpcH/HpaI aldolase family protein [Haliscomenobacter hydrossis]|uniref:2-dehydro-3-deoxyglucarate aldolase n=1 Tax=Haliscomenobacter hydrossis (strain ATCC 27775 / DSM 1100 / LMG 10767 / O) TaxID=760192 RepID=F4KU61_HALH1|nr:aldolase/citrate lyase family protein [Haliscomenobacter hydrossis]AEE50158.1 2-dehydro-3-deoxyglucarate aldolase [Haliscomenobacter hydrossis DSM 1100]
MKNLKKRLQNGETLHGCWLNLGSPLTAEIVGLSGFDWVLIDLEHGAGTEKEALAQMQGLEHTAAGIVVRVESAEPQRIQRILDMGAEGIMCPKINTPQEAQKVANGLHYPPIGQRGVAKMVRATQFAQNFQTYYEGSQENVLGIVQIETRESLHHLEEIAQVPGVDVLFIGPADLSMELGIFGQFDHPMFIDALQRTIAAANKAGKATGILFFNPNDYGKYHQMGIRFIACGADGTFVADGAKNMAEKLAQFRSAL